MRSHGVVAVKLRYMSHIVSITTRVARGLTALNLADEAAVQWLGLALSLKVNNNNNFI